MEPILFIAFGIVIIGFWFWAIIDITRSRFKNPNMRTVWLIVVLLLPLMGTLIWLFVRKDLVTTEPRKFNPKFNRESY